MSSCTSSLAVEDSHKHSIGITAATNDYFHYHLQIIRLINHFVNKMLKVKMYLFLESNDDVFKYISFDQQFKTKIFILLSGMKEMLKFETSIANIWLFC